MNLQLYYLMIERRVRGPYSREQILDLFRRRHISDETLACAHDFQIGWSPPTDLRLWRVLRWWLPEVLDEPREKTGSESVEISCPVCAAQLRLPTVDASKTWRCPSCKSTFSLSFEFDGPPVFTIHETKARKQDDLPPSDKSATRRNPTAYEVLEISQTATQEEIRAAFKRRIQQYHPDKVSHLGIEFRALAEERTKEIIIAYQELRRD